MPGPDRAFLDPALEQFDLLRLERLVLLGRRHHVVRVRGGETADHLALLRRARHHRDLARLRLPQRGLLEIEAQVGLELGRIRPVAGVAVLREDGSDVAVEINLGRRRSRGGARSQSTAQNACGQQARLNIESSHHRNGVILPPNSTHTSPQTKCDEQGGKSGAFVRKGRADYLRWPDGEMVETGFVLKRMWAKHSGMWESQMP